GVPRRIQRAIDRGRSHGLTGERAIVSDSSDVQNGTSVTQALNHRLSFAADVFEWCLRNARRTFASARMEDSAQWALLAARAADIFGCGYFASPPLEHHLLSLAGPLPRPAPRTPSHGPAMRWLHVMTESPVGGHTVLVNRWIALDTAGDENTV